MLCGEQMPSAAEAAEAADDGGTAQILRVEADHSEDRATVVAEPSHQIAASHEVCA